jgi:hypothetical protein
MINVLDPISPTVTDRKSKLSRVRLRGTGHSKKLKELRAKKEAGQNNVNDREARIAMVLSGEDFPAASDIDAQITAELLNWEATSEAEQALKAQLDAAYREAATAELARLKKPHDAVVNPMLTSLIEFAAAYVELFQLSRDLKDKSVGWREGVCDLVPQLVDLFGAANVHSPLAGLLREAVRLGYVKASQLPKEMR